MSGIILKDIKKIYPGGVIAVNNFNLEIEDKEFMVLVGPSGCGKSTVLRMIAGLEEVTNGELYIDGQLINDIAPKDRDIAMVFQNYALYPHMTIYKNLAFSLSLRKEPKNVIDKKVKETAKLLEIEHLLNRKPKALSGGQRQRVALGRAMVREPKAFLLDEPLSNLDAKLRASTRTEIAKLHKKVGTTFVYVTHDQTEAMTMADRIVVMKDGSIHQIGKPQELYESPCNMFVAGFIGTPQMNFIDAILEKNETGYYALVDNSRFALSEVKYKSNILDEYIGKKIVLGIRSENIIEVKDDSTRSDVLNTTVEVYEHMGSEIYAYMDYSNQKIIARFNSEASSSMNDNLKITFNPEKIHIFDKETEISLLELKSPQKI
ncbi:ABC transporter ATP-binding protein [Sedimentibacter sp. MB31-C6]|uniref:ABC transporter ATP-binding protein n=1 Tax=Sedimentibacter sp. MB31-C6 TaxID=3109366 RepID=UPI002DDD159B|nr:sn-glycerol-3-phosphate ABC transporter ATP-binding protein UgpC [Sedimentibacter sp. MB36-C1]WSI03679.1 sn-glycerol-3-phosphate ABC transporter ATP-binding protein UgpC [Sedimentibacter sp. MB36-C1]